MSTLLEVSNVINNIDIKKEWEKSIFSKTMRISLDMTAKSLTGKDKSGAANAKGVYMHYLDDGTILYIGKGQRMTIAQRQSCHFASFRNPNNTNEMSGKKYRKYLKEKDISELNIHIKYINMTHLPHHMIPMFEDMSIEYFKPLINQETENA